MTNFSMYINITDRAYKDKDKDADKKKDEKDKPVEPLKFDWQTARTA